MWISIWYALNHNAISKALAATPQQHVPSQEILAAWKPILCSDLFASRPVFKRWMPSVVMLLWPKFRVSRFCVDVCLMTRLHWTAVQWCGRSKLLKFITSRWWRSWHVGYQVTSAHFSICLFSHPLRVASWLSEKRSIMYLLEGSPTTGYDYGTVQAAFLVTLHSISCLIKVSFCLLYKEIQCVYIVHQVRVWQGAWPHCQTRCSVCVSETLYKL